MSRDKRAIVHLMVNDGTKTAANLTRLINYAREDKFTTETIQHALMDKDLISVERKKKICLSKSHRKARLNKALEHQN